MSRKRELIAKLLPNGLPLLEVLNDNARFVAIRRERFSTCPEYATRDELYDAVAPRGAITYLEFGVWKGASIDKWRKLNSHPGSRFYGFDSFEGLPEDWKADHPKGTFSTAGVTPKIHDARVSFIKGWFQDTLRGFLNETSVSNRLVINVDCDLYSATLFVLGTLDKYFCARHYHRLRRFLFDESRVQGIPSQRRLVRPQVEGDRQDVSRNRDRVLTAAGEQRHGASSALVRNYLAVVRQ
jgi:hypothetical protein